VQNLKTSEEEFEVLAACDHVIQQFSPLHFRIDGRVDVWPSTKKWYDRITFRKGSYTDLVQFARAYLSEVEETKALIYG
jgi:hypothetical protein